MPRSIVKKSHQCLNVVYVNGLIVGFMCVAPQHVDMTIDGLRRFFEVTDSNGDGTLR